MVLGKGGLARAYAVLALASVLFALAACAPQPGALASGHKALSSTGAAGKTEGGYDPFLANWGYSSFHNQAMVSKGIPAKAIGNFV